MDTIPSFQDVKSPEDETNNKALACGDQAECIDEIFEGHGPYSEEFSVQEFSQPTGSAVWKPYVEETPMKEDEVHKRVRDKDMYAHHRSVYPLVHHPLKPGYHRKGRTKGRKHKEEKQLEAELSHDQTGEGSLNSTPDMPSISAEKDSQDTSLISTSSPLKEQGLDYSDVSRSTTTTTTAGGSLMGGSPPTSDDESTEVSMLLSPDIIRLKSCIRSETDTGGSEEDAPSLGSGLSDRKKSRVKFDIGSDGAESEHEVKKQRPRKRRHHRRKHSFEDPVFRRQVGSEKHHPQPFTITTTEDEATLLNEHELEEISTHRIETKALRRRHSIKAKSSMSSIIHPSKFNETSISSKGGSVPILKKTFDHNPHEVFVELAELQPTSLGGLEWKETARWIKYEEDVEGADNRWGKPHIAFLNFNALFSLRKGIERGAVLLDLDEHDLSSVAARVVDHMVACDQIPPEQRDSVIGILLLRHKHIKEGHHHAFRRSSRGSKLHLVSTSEERLNKSASAAQIEFKPNKKSLNFLHGSTFTSLGQVQSDDGSSPVSNGHKLTNMSNSYTQIEIDSDNEFPTTHRKSAAMNKDLLKKLPKDAEATAVLVGAVDFLKQPTIAFVRLAQGVNMENVVEVPIPVRFLFILLGPYNGEMDYHEVGRAISTLMSDKCFHEVAYKAHTRGQLLTAINEFLNASIVFPPSEWKNDDLIPIDEIKAKTREILKKNEDLKARKKYAQLKEAKAVSQPPTDRDEGDGWEPPRDPLQRKGKPFYGLIQDVKIRYSQYWSDVRDGLSSQVLSACIFIFFAALSPTITFGGIYADLTDKYIGVGETLLVSSINGAIFALFAAQPLLIVGATGPLMIFDISLLQFCNSLELDFLSIRVWVGIWLLVFGLLVAAFEAVAVVKKFTRFTEEIFSTLVCFIFIYGAFEKLAAVFKKNPLSSSSCSGYVEPNATTVLKRLHKNYLDDNDLYENDEDDKEEKLSSMVRLMLESNVRGEDLTGTGENEPNTALLSMCLMLGTFFIAWKLKKFRNSKFLGRGVRRALGDFGVPIAIFLMVFLDWVIHDTYTDKLSMPSGLQPSNADVRGWFINPLGVVDPLPVWCMVAACPAALLLFVLIFIEENICHLILSKPERCLKKGSGFHLDIVLSCLINTVSGVLGAPFMGPACVRTIAHMSSLTVMSTNGAPGESPKIVGCIEQRISALTVSILVGLSVMLYSILNLVPTAVLLGIFLYMGISATAGIQILERVVLFFMPVKHHPNVPYVRKVRTRKMHAFTAVQLSMLAVLWVVKQSPAALAIPFVLMCLVPLRLYILPLIFTNIELIALDGKDQTILDEPDFYETAHDLPTQIEKDNVS